MSEDARQRFIFEGSACRGHIVKLDSAWSVIRESRDYPQAIAQLLGEACVATMLLAGSVKIKGNLGLQASGSGPISLLVVQANSEGGLRAMAKYSQGWDGESLQTAFGDNGQLSISIDPGKDKQRYQGIVSLQGDKLQDALGAYFVQSEQLKTSFWLAVSEQGAAGMFLQQLPSLDMVETDAWERVNHLANTLQREELLELPAKEILHRLFHQEEVRLFDPEPLHLYCDCSRQRIANVLRGLGYDEVQAALQEQGVVKVDCEFCGTDYQFDAVDIEQLFVDDVITPVPDQLH